MQDSFKNVCKYWMAHNSTLIDVTVQWDLLLTASKAYQINIL